MQGYVHDNPRSKIELPVEGYFRSFLAINRTDNRVTRINLKFAIILFVFNDRFI